MTNCLRTVDKPASDMGEWLMPPGRAETGPQWPANPSAELLAAKHPSAAIAWNEGYLAGLEDGRSDDDDEGCSPNPYLPRLR